MSASAQPSGHHPVPTPEHTAPPTPDHTVSSEPSTTSLVRLSPATLQWALECAEIPPHEADKLLPRRVLDDWVTRGADLSGEEIRHIAARASIPLGYLYMDNPSNLDPGVPDYRAVTHTCPPMSRNLRDAITNAHKRITFYTDYIEECAGKEGIECRQGTSDAPREDREEPTLLACATIAELPHEAAQRLRDTLDWPPTTPQAGDNPLQPIEDLTKRLSDHGLLVSRAGFVDIDGHRAFDKDELAGFILIEAPTALIFINTTHAPATQLFTLARAVGHVLLGQEGIIADAPLSDTSDHDTTDEELKEKAQIRRWCSRFAEGFLMPDDVLSGQPRHEEARNSRIGADATSPSDAQHCTQDRSHPSPADGTMSDPSNRSNREHLHKAFIQHFGIPFLQAAQAAYDAGILGLRELYDLLGSDDEELVDTVMNRIRESAAANRWGAGESLADDPEIQHFLAQARASAQADLAASRRR